MTWQKVWEGVWLYRDSCNVYAVEAEAGMVIINAGTGRWLDALGALPKPVAALACTHYFRDHSAGTVAAVQESIPIYVPEGEYAVFADPEQHFRQRQTYIIYDNLWNLYAPIQAVPIAGVLRDYETLSLAGRDFEIIPLPGVTFTQAGLSITLQNGQRGVFCGEAIHSPGRLARVAPLQYNYNDINGAIQCHAAAQTLRHHRPTALFPSLGEPICEGADAALELLQTNLKHLGAVRPGVKETMEAQSDSPLERVTDHVWLDRHSVANTWYLISDSGKALAIDYGYHKTTCSAWPSYPHPEQRRALLHGLDGLKQQFGIDHVDVVLVSHFHDDHVCGIPVLQRVYGTECWAAENFADLLEHPESHCFPCDWHKPSHINRRLKLNETFQWEEYTFHLHPMSGHTRFASLIGFEADGRRFAHTGDQYFFSNGVEDFTNNRRSQNHVYRNGALLDGYAESGRWMQEWKPDIVLQGHQPAMHTDAAFFQHIADWNEDYAGLHRLIMPLGDNETHFNLDSWGGWITPYRTHLPTTQPFTATVTVRNPFPHPAKLEVCLVGPTGWKGYPQTLEAEARAEVSCELTLHPTTPCRRQPFAVELTANGQPFGQVAEALLTVGGEAF